MPSRWSEFDTDLERLPHGMTRVGYDADTQVYSYRDSDGSMWEGAPGCKHGVLHRVSWPGYGSATGSTTPPQTEAEAESQLRHKEQHHEKRSDLTWRGEMMPLLNFLVIVGSFLLVAMYFFSRPGQASTDSEGVAVGHAEQQETGCLGGTRQYVVKDGDTCWGIAQAHGMATASLVDINEGVVCDALEVGQIVCIPDHE